MVCMLLVPKGMSKSNNNCPSHTWQIPISLSSLQRLCRAAAPFLLRSSRSSGARSVFEQPLGVRGGGGGGLPPTMLAPGLLQNPRLLLPFSNIHISICWVLGSEQITLRSCALMFLLYISVWSILPNVTTGCRTEKSCRNHNGNC